MARLAPLADKLLASLAQFTHSVKQTHSARLATDIACFTRAKSHTKARIICPGLVLLASGAPCFWLQERHLVGDQVATW